MRVFTVVSVNEMAGATLSNEPPEVVAGGATVDATWLSITLEGLPLKWANLLLGSQSTFHRISMASQSGTCLPQMDISRGATTLTRQTVYMTSQMRVRHPCVAFTPMPGPPAAQGARR